MIKLENCVVTEDSITISKQELERLIKHYDKQIDFFWNPKPLSPQSWGVGIFQGKREMCEDFLKLINGERNISQKRKTTVEKAVEVFAEMLVELCPELLGFGGAAKEWENEFRKRLEE